MTSAYYAPQDFGRQGQTGTFTNTIKPKSAEQAMLVQMDAMVANWNGLLTAVAAATDVPSLQAGIAAAVADHS